MSEPPFDITEVFDDDYLYFYAGMLDDERSEHDVELIWRLLGLEPGMEVLDAPCGHGRIANRLAERGVRVTGLDATRRFLELARADASERGVEVEYAEGDLRTLPWTERFDRVFCWFTSFGYFDDDGNRSVLAGAYRALRPGGAFAVELNHLPWILMNYRREGVVEREGDLMIDRATFDPLTGRNLSERIVVRGGRVRRFRFFLRMMAFPELRDWLGAAGFERVEGFDQDGGPLTMESRRLVSVAWRPAAG